jgi:hypothetical protein
MAWASAASTPTSWLAGASFSPPAAVFSASEKNAERSCAQGGILPPKIENLGVSAFGDEDVRGLDVEVNDAFDMRRVKRVRDIDGRAKQLFRFECAYADQLLPGEPVQVLHDHEGTAVFFENVVNGADVGVVQCRSSPPLASKTLQCLWVAGKVIGQKLEGDEAGKTGILGFVDDPMPPPPM